MIRAFGDTSGAQISVAPSSWNPADRSIEILASMGADVVRRDWRDGSTYIERLSMEPGAVDLTRLNSGVAPLLDTHDMWDTGTVRGVIPAGSARVENGGLAIKAVLSDAAGDADFARKVETGILRAASMGYLTLQQSIDDSGPVQIRTATLWQPYEVSIVPVGADPAAQTRSGNGLALPAQNVHNRNEPEPANPAQPIQRSAMTPEEIAAAKEANERAIAAAADAAVAADRTRRSDIETSARKLQLDPESPEVRAFIDGKRPIADVRAALIDLRAVKANAVPTSSATRAVEITVSERETRTAGMEEAMLRKHAPGVIPADKFTENGNRFLGMGTKRIAEQCLQDCGIDTRYLSDDEIMARALVGMNSAFGMAGMQRSGSNLGTSDFPIIMSNLMGKKLRKAYSELPQDWKKLSTQTSADTFKPQTSIQIGEGTNLQLVGEDGEIPQGSTSESSETWKLQTFGQLLNLTRQMLINDQLGAFLRFIGMRGAAAARLENQTFWALFNANSGAGKTMGDGYAICSTQHKNIVSGGGNVGAPSAATLSASRLLLDKQTGIDGALIEVKPSFLIAPSELRGVVGQLLSRQIVPTQASNVLPDEFFDLSPVVSPRLTNASKWFLAASPAEIEMFIHAYLGGQEGPYFEQRLGWEVDGIQTKIRLDFGVGVNDFRGIVMNPGA